MLLIMLMLQVRLPGIQHIQHTDEDAANPHWYKQRPQDDGKV